MSAAMNATASEPAPQGFVPDPKPRRFDFEVAPGGYAWWYLDVLDRERGLGLTAIFFIGSVFSPHYFRARQRALAAGQPLPSPESFCAVNLALYAPRGMAGPGRAGPRAWALTEHPEFERGPRTLRIGASSLRWTEDDRGPLLTARIDEREPFLGKRAPWTKGVRGTVRLRPAAIFGPRVELDGWRSEPEPEARHRWYPVGPHGHAEVEFEEPALRFSGSAYTDVNEGDEPLEAAFAHWNWSRLELGERTVIVYDVVDRSGQPRPLAWSFDPRTRTREALDPDALGDAVDLPRSRWGMHRATRVPLGAHPRLLDTLEDSPFYTRNVVTLDGDERSLAMHESLDLDRFCAGSTQFLLPFKTRRG